MPQGIVISLEILVIGMGDRGSKSVIYLFLPVVTSRVYTELCYYCKRATSRRFFN